MMGTFADNREGAGLHASYTVESIASTVRDLSAPFYLFSFAILLSIVFPLRPWVLILYYKQISEGYEDQARFEIMQRVGMTKTDIRKSINSQLLLVFFLPLLFAGLHLCFAFPFIHKLLILFNLTNLKLLIGTTVITFRHLCGLHTLVTASHPIVLFHRRRRKGGSSMIRFLLLSCSGAGPDEYDRLYVLRRLRGRVAAGAGATCCCGSRSFGCCGSLPSWRSLPAACFIGNGRNARVSGRLRKPRADQRGDPRLTDQAARFRGFRPAPERLLTTQATKPGPSAAAWPLTAAGQEALDSLDIQGCGE